MNDKTRIDALFFEIDRLDFEINRLKKELAHKEKLLENQEKIINLSKDFIENYNPFFALDEPVQVPSCIFCNKCGWMRDHFDGCPWEELEEEMKKLNEGKK